MARPHKPQRSKITAILAALSPVPAPPTAAAQAGPPPKQAGIKVRTRQQTLYLEPAVYEQLRQLAFVERTKMHSLAIEGLDLVFKSRGMRSIAELSGRKPEV